MCHVIALWGMRLLRKKASDLSSPDILLADGVKFAARSPSLSGLPAALDPAYKLSAKLTVVTGSALEYDCCTLHLS